MGVSWRRALAIGRFAASVFQAMLEYCGNKSIELRSVTISPRAETDPPRVEGGWLTNDSAAASSKE